MIDNSKLSFFRKYDLKSSIAKEAGFKVSMQLPKNISDTTTTPILEEINTDLEYGEISPHIVQEHPNAIHKRLTEALRGGYRKPSDRSVPLPSADSDISINDGGKIIEPIAVSLLTQVIAVLAASSIVSRPSRKVRESKRKDRDKAVLIKSRLASVRSILDSVVDFLFPVRVYSTLARANINPILLLFLNGTLYVDLANTPN